jgi:XTP/dITP diphosphohydrolase
MELVVATGNPHKVEEIRAILADVDPSLRVLGLHEVGGPFPEPAETGATFEENATIKARAYAAATGRVCLADDSGLEVDALGGRPGVISSHYSTDGRETGTDRATRDAMNTARVLRELEGVPPEERGARFRCVVVVAVPGGVLHRAEGIFPGRIGVPPAVPRGGGGFGYDPIFLVGPDYARTSAELSAAEKHAVSHRGAALRALATLLRDGPGPLTRHADADPDAGSDGGDGLDLDVDR